MLRRSSQHALHDLESAIQPQSHEVNRRIPKPGFLEVDDPDEPPHRGIDQEVLGTEIVVDQHGLLERAGVPLEEAAEAAQGGSGELLGEEWSDPQREELAKLGVARAPLLAASLHPESLAHGSARHRVKGVERVGELDREDIVDIVRSQRPTRNPSVAGERSLSEAPDPLEAGHRERHVPGHHGEQALLPREISGDDRIAREAEDPVGLDREREVGPAAVNLSHLSVLEAREPPKRLASFRVVHDFLMSKSVGRQPVVIRPRCSRPSRAATIRARSCAVEENAMARADLAIRNARVLDGSGAPAFDADLEVREGRIARIGTAGDARETIDAAGQILSPGFVDTHTHDDAALLLHPGMEFKLAQGCTSVVIGNCGFSAAPHRDDRAAAPGGQGLFSRLRTDWTDLEGYMASVDRVRPALNVVALIGHNTVRALVMGNEERAPTRAELGEMRDHLALGLEQGACGFSSGLIYRPGRYSTTEEVAAIAEPLGGYGALYATHMRNEGERLLEAVDEALAIGREARCPVHISHHKAAGRANWGKVGESLAAIDRANASGADVTLDVYPYTAGSGPLVEYVELERIPEEFAEAIQIASCPAFPELEGRRVPEIAKSLGLPLGDVIRKILTAPRGERTICIQFVMDEVDVETNLRHPRVMIGSDGIPDLSGQPHPRLFGTMPRVLARYVRERGVLPLEEAVRRMTSLSCERFGLRERGRIREGYWADLVLFDPESVLDTASYEEPKREPVGIEQVIVNGRVAYQAGRHTGVGAGRLLRYREDGERATP